MLSVPPTGHTASGQAIIAAAYLMPKSKKRRILIHVTDGESNYGCDIQNGIDYCMEQKIDLITLACGYKDREVMRKQYGKSIQFIDHFGQLPTAFESLFKWIMLYKTKNGNSSLPFKLDMNQPVDRIDSDRSSPLLHNSSALKNEKPPLKRTSSEFLGTPS